MNSKRLQVFFLECGAHLQSDAMLMGSGQLVIVQAAHILNMYNLEDVMDAHAELHVRTIRIDDIAALGEVHEHRTARILVEMGVVLLRQLAPQDTEAEPLAPLEFADERDAVEYLSVEVPVELTRQEAVGWELHVVDSLEGIVLYDIREVGLGHDEQWEGNLLPLYSTLYLDIHLTP